MKLLIAIISLAWPILGVCQEAENYHADSMNKHLLGTWRDSLTNEKFQYVIDTRYMVIAQDTMLFQRGVLGGTGVIQLLEWEINNDTIRAKEIEVLGVDLNIGFARYHYINRNMEVDIPLCEFQNNCVKDDKSIYSSTVLIKESTDTSFSFHDIVSQWRKSPSFETDY